MLIYVDLLFILNLWIDFLLLITTNLILNYKISYKKVLFASLIGAFSTFSIVINNKLILFIIKIVIAIIMQIIVNSYKGIKTLIENVFYFYLVSIILAGTLYLLKLDKMSMKYNYLLLLVVTPIILYINHKKIKKLDNYYKEIYSVTVIYRNKKYIFNAFLDTGNVLYDQYKKRPISLIYTNKIKFNYDDGLLVPIETANKKSLLKCIKVDKLIVEDKEIKNAIIGLMDKKFNIQDINMILHKDILGGRKWFYFYLE